MTTFIQRDYALEQKLVELSNVRDRHCRISKVRIKYGVAVPMIMHPQPLTDVGSPREPYSNGTILAML